MANVTFDCVHAAAVIPKVAIVVVQRESMEQRTINLVKGTAIAIDDGIVAISHDIYRKLARGLIKVTAGTLLAESNATPATTTPVLAVTN